MATPGNYPLDFYRGDSYRWNVVCWADSGKTQPLDLTGVTPRSEIRPTEGGTPVLTVTCNVSPPNTVVCYLPPAVSKQLPVAGGVWDLQLTYPSGDVVSVLRGPVTVTADVTASS